MFGSSSSSSSTSPKFPDFVNRFIPASWQSPPPPPIPKPLSSLNFTEPPRLRKMTHADVLAAENPKYTGPKYVAPPDIVAKVEKEFADRKIAADARMAALDQELAELRAAVAARRAAQPVPEVPPSAGCVFARNYFPAGVAEKWFRCPEVPGKQSSV